MRKGSPDLQSLLRCDRPGSSMSTRQPHMDLRCSCVDVVAHRSRSLVTVEPLFVSVEPLLFGLYVKTGPSILYLLGLGQIRTEQH